MPEQSAPSLTLPVRALLLLASLLLFLILNTVGAGAQSGDDHGNTFAEATPISLGSSIAGRIDPTDPGSDPDVDAFSLDLSGRQGVTDVWIYTTGDLDTAGGLYDLSSNNPFLWNDDSSIVGRQYNFHLRATLAPGTYYVGVFSADETTTGSYTLHVEAVTDHGSSVATATRLNFDSPTAGTIKASNDSDYFRLDLASSTNVYLYGRSVDDKESVIGWTVNSLNNFVPANIHHEDNEFFVRDDFGPGAHYVKVFARDVTSYPVYYTVHAYVDTAYPAFIEDCEAKTQALNAPQITDSLYGCQWHLRNQGGVDINVEPVWADGIEGQGVNIAVVDDGMDFAHEDLVDNVNTSLNHDYTGLGSIFNPFMHHGTYVAGVIAARDNGIGVRGVAPQATIYGYNYMAQQTIFNESDAMTRNATGTAVSNNSWGSPDDPGLGHANSLWELAVESGTITGYNGKGTFYVWAAGNGHQEGDDSNLDEQANYYGVTAVCAVNDGDVRASYSESGANLWVCALSGDDGADHSNIVTTENYDRYVYDFDGTSAAAPIVSGVAALMRQANPNLTWRDLKLILAASARKNDPANTGWENGARKYGATSTTDLYHFSHEYGFGTVDAKVAVDMAKAWSGSLPPLQSSTSTSGSLNVQVPDAPETGDPTAVTRSLTLSTDIGFTEFVEVNVTFDHSSFRDLDIDLVSPSGAVSHLTVPFDTFTDDGDTNNDYVPLQGTFRLGSARHLGENPNGVWQLRVTDHFHLEDGIFESWSIKVYGHSSAPTDTVTVSLASANVPVRVNSPIAVTATFSEPVSGFTVDDVSVANGTAGNFVGSDGSSVYTFDVTPNAIGAVTVDIAAGAAVDTDGNGNTAAVQLRLGIPYDDDKDGAISSTEVLTAVADYFRDRLSAQLVLQVVALYFSSTG